MCYDGFSWYASGKLIFIKEWSVKRIIGTMVCRQKEWGYYSRVRRRRDPRKGKHPSYVANS